MSSTSTEDSSRQLLRIVEQALELPSQRRHAWLVEHCPAPLRVRAERLIDSADAPTDLGEEEITLIVHGAANPLAGTRIGAYRILELIGEGGMGQVYLAQRDDGAFDAQVAVKVIRTSAVGSRAVAQFERERQILSDLHHPAIATLLDGGTTDDGMPYVVMEYIDGQPLDAYLQSRELPMEARLGLFLQVCAAVEHAHQHLIIHRDIKPSNILVTADGAPKLLDFGIARSLEGDAGSDQTVAMLLTPAYASPEQVTGEPLTTATDVYSLGIVLYQLLTGERPYETEKLTPSQYEQLITERTPQAPSARARQRALSEWKRLRGDLDAIVLQALAKEPSRRYAGVTAFADDIRRFLRGFPVQAKGDSLTYHFGKFVKRRRYAAAAGLLFLGGIAGAYAITWDQYLSATQARARADARFDQSRALAREVLYDVYDRMAHVQGTLEAREQLATTGERYLDELAADPTAPPDLLLDIGSHYARLYDLYAGFGVSSLGQTAKGYEQLVKSERALRQLLALEPGNPGAIAEMLWVKRLATHHTLNYDADTDTAFTHASEGLTLADEAMATLTAPDWRLESRRWNLRIDLVKVLIWAKEFDRALALLDDFLPQLDQPGWEQNLRNWAAKRAYAYGMRGEAYSDAGDPAAAIPDLTVSLAYFQQRIAREPDNGQILTQLIRANDNLSKAYLASKQGEDALRHSLASHQAASRMLEAEPRDTQARRNLALVQQQSAKAYAQLGRHGDAKDTIDAAIATFRDLADADGSNQALVRDQAVALLDAGDLAAARGAASEGCPYYRHAESLWKVIAEQDPTLTPLELTQVLEPIRQRLGDHCP